MPEGHTLHRLATEMETVFGGQVVTASSPQGRFADGATRISGLAMEHAESAGKHLFLRFTGDTWLHVHLGLYGNVRFGPAPAPPPVGQVRLRLQTELSYVDLRGPTICSLITEEERSALLTRLGPDPLQATSDPEQVWRRISKSRTPIGVLLLDQRVLAGVGNVFRAEVLFRAGINPLRPSHRLRKAQWTSMWADLVELMAYGVETGRIDTVRPEHTPEAMGRGPRTDNHGGEVYVYRRTGQPCHVCGSKIRTQVVAGRNLFWCPRCQRRGKI
jgi:endonuclease VIII